MRGPGLREREERENGLFRARKVHRMQRDREGRIKQVTPVAVRQGVSDQRAAPVGGAPGDGVDVIPHSIGARWGGVRM